MDPSPKKDSSAFMDRLEHGLEQVVGAVLRIGLAAFVVVWAVVILTAPLWITYLRCQGEGG